MDRAKRKAQDGERTVECVVLRDFWDAEGVRHREGTVIAASVEEALDGVEAGILSRVK